MKKPIRTVSIFILLLGCMTSVRAASLQQILQETQRISHTKNTLDLVWWIPTQYWTILFKENPSLTSEQKTQVQKVLEPYLIFAVFRQTIGVFGGAVIPNREQVLANIAVHADGHTLKPLKMTKLSPDASNFFLMIKPLLARSLGQLGTGLHFIVYPNVKGDRRLIDPLKPGRLECSFFGNTYHWKLPLGCLLPPVYDPKTNETFPGNYRYNPFTGDPLIRKPHRTSKHLQRHKVS